MNKTAISIVLYVIALIFVVVAIVYFVTPANHLPGFFPGHDASLTKHHTTHGIAAIVLALIASLIAWFQGGKKSA